jgi:TRAP-type C4-dicarboxylate transport system permease small subunit
MGSPVHPVVSRNPLLSAIAAAGTWTAIIIQLVGAVAVVALAVHTAVDVARRELLGGGAIGTLEFVTNYYMVAAVFMGLMVAQRQREHIEVSVLFDRLPVRSRRLVALAGQLLTIGFVLALANYGFLEAMSNMEQGEHSGVVDVPIWPSRFLVPLGFLAYAIHLGIDAVSDFRSRVFEGGVDPGDGALET